MAPPARPRPSTVGPDSTLATVLSDTPAGRLIGGVRLMPDIVSAVLVGLIAFAVYFYTSPQVADGTDYFVRLADAFLHGRIYVTDHPSWLTELVPRDGVYYIPYVPMPGVLLVPFVALFGPSFHQQWASALFGGISVGLAWLVLARFELRLRDRQWLIAVFAFGTVLWYVAEVGNSWYLAHTVALMFALAALLPALDRRRPFLVGLLVGCAALARLPVGLTAPFYLAMLLGMGWPLRLPSDRRRALRTAALFGLGIAIPAAVELAYNMARWGSPLETGYTLIPGVLTEPWFSSGLLSLDYLPRHFYAIFLRSFNFVDGQPPYLQPSWWGLSLFLTTPLFLWLAKARYADPRVIYASIAIMLGLLPDVLHGSIGFAQFGYRFSLDVQPLLFVLLATAFKGGMSRQAKAAATLAVLVNAYGVWAIGVGFVAY